MGAPLPPSTPISGENISDCAFCDHLVDAHRRVGGPSRRAVKPRIGPRPEFDNRHSKKSAPVYNSRALVPKRKSEMALIA
jgi:hypothetical protein